MEILLLFKTILVIYLTLHLALCQRLSGGMPYSITSYIPFYTNTSKWFIIDKYLYYVERAEKLPNEAQQYCKNSQMQDGIQPTDTENLSKYLINTYGPTASCWMGQYEHNYNNYTSTGMENSTTCYAINANGVYSQDCSSRMCVICKQEISGGSLQYKNGTHFEVDIDQIIEFCNPESWNYDNLIQYCLIEGLPYQIN